MADQLRLIETNRLLEGCDLDSLDEFLAEQRAQFASVDLPAFERDLRRGLAEPW